MSDIQLKSEIDGIIKQSGYSKSKELLCPIMRILSMRHKNVSTRRIHDILKDRLC